MKFINTAKFGFRNSHGLTLVETLISLSISAALMVSAAAAFSASSTAVSANADYFRASQAARVTMDQVLNEVRQCESVQVVSDHIDIIRTTSMLTANEVFRRFQFDSTNHVVILAIYDASNHVIAGPYEMASNVTSATFGPAITGQDWNNTVVVQHVPVSITVTAGKNIATLTGAAGPKRAQRTF